MFIVIYDIFNTLCDLLSLSELSTHFIEAEDDVLAGEHGVGVVPLELVGHSAPSGREETTVWLALSTSFIDAMHNHSFQWSTILVQLDLEVDVMVRKIERPLQLVSLWYTSEVCECPHGSNISL
jgi:hypothetical protein